jgi:uncharacterized protein YcgI (DUF1989 family)
VIAEDQTLRIVDLEGQQAVDFLCYNAARPEERYNAPDTMKYAGSIYITRGVSLYSGLGRKLFTVVEYTCGHHDTIGGCCSAESNELRYGVKDTPNCRDTSCASAPSRLGPTRLEPRPVRGSHRAVLSRRVIATVVDQT